MTKTKPTKTPTYADFIAMYPTEEAQHREQVKIQSEEGWTITERSTSYVEKYKRGWAEGEKDQVARGEIRCPVCFGVGKYRVQKQGNQPDTSYIFKRELTYCECLKWKHMWNLIRKELRTYSFVNLDTITPSSQNLLPKAVQEEEINYIRKYRNDNFWFMGTPGTGKTTMAYALYRHAFERDQAAFWKESRRDGLEFDKTRWIWQGNFETILMQYNAKYIEKDKEAPEPYITPAKIYEAKEAGYRPFLLLEEVDKTRLTEYKANFLFGLVDAMLNTGGQLVLTSNLNLNEFDTNFLRQEETRVVGTTMTRRLTYTTHVRNYFEYRPAE